MRDRVVRGGAIAAAGLIFLAAACSSSGSGDPGASGTSVDGSSITAASFQQTSTMPNGTPQPTTSGTGLPVRNGDGTPVTNPDTGVVVTTPSIPEGPTTPPTQPPPDYVLQWKLAVDYRTHPGTNPFADYRGGPKVWSLREGSSRNGDYQLLPTYSARFVASGVSAWHDDTAGCMRTPVIAANTINAPASMCNAQIPSNATMVHPSSSQMAVVAWTSLFDGTVNISSGVADLDPSCGDGVRFSVDRGTTELSAITLTNANALMLDPITTPVTFGEPLFFIIDAGLAGDAACDTTQLVVTILRS